MFFGTNKQHQSKAVSTSFQLEKLYYAISSTNSNLESHFIRRKKIIFAQTVLRNLVFFYYILFVNWRLGCYDAENKLQTVAQVCSREKEPFEGKYKKKLLQENSDLIFMVIRGSGT